MVIFLFWLHPNSNDGKFGSEYVGVVLREMERARVV